MQWQFRLVSFGANHDVLHEGGGSAMLSVTDRCQGRCGDWLTVCPICAIRDRIRLALWSRDTLSKLDHPMFRYPIGGRGLTPVEIRPNRVRCGRFRTPRKRTKPISRKAIDLLREILAIPAGLEPATRGVEIRYSIQLSYGTVPRPASGETSLVRPGGLLPWHI